MKAALAIAIAVVCLGVILYTGESGQPKADGILSLGPDTCYCNYAYECDTLECDVCISSYLAIDTVYCESYSQWQACVAAHESICIHEPDVPIE